MHGFKTGDHAMVEILDISHSRTMAWVKYEADDALLLPLTALRPLPAALSAEDAAVIEAAVMVELSIAWKAMRQEIAGLRDDLKAARAAPAQEAPGNYVAGDPVPPEVMAQIFHDLDTDVQIGVTSTTVRDGAAISVHASPSIAALEKRVVEAAMTELASYEALPCQDVSERMTAIGAVRDAASALRAALTPKPRSDPVEDLREAAKNLIDRHDRFMEGDQDEFASGAKSIDRLRAALAAMQERRS